MASIKHISSALPMIARALGDHLGVEVRQGSKACTDGNVIFLPPMPEDEKVFKDRKYTAYELAKVLGIGMVVHESSHVRYTDFESVKLGDLTPVHRFLTNALEDIRIEYKIAKDFPGTADDLQQMVTVLSMDGFWSPSKDDDHPASVMQNWLLYKLRHDYLGQTGIADVLAETDRVFRNIIPEGVGIKLEALMFDVDLCKSTTDVVTLAGKILKMIQEEAEKEEENEEDQDQGDGDDSQGQNQSQDNGAADGDNSGDKSKDKEGQAGDQQSDQIQGQGSGDKSEGNDSNGDGMQQAADGAGNGTHKQEVLKQILEAGEDAKADDLGETLAGILNSMADPSQGVVMANKVKAKSMGHDMGFIQETQGSVNALKHRLQIMLQSHARSRVLSCASGNQLRSSRLHTAKLGGNVFQKKIKTVQVNTAVKVLLDLSASMSGVKVEVAKRAAFALGMSLEAIPGVKVSVATFPDSDGRWLSIKDINGFNEPVKSCSKNFSSMQVCGNTPLAESLYSAWYDLIKQREPRKILLVITDGQPNNIGKAVTLVKDIEKSGVEICGIGIQLNVEHIFRRNATINDVSDLSQAMFTMMQDVMLKAA